MQTLRMRARSFLQQALRSRALTSENARRLYRRFFWAGGEDYADLLRDAGVFHAVGDHCSIQQNVVITDPKLVSMGNNVRLSGCTLFGHDGSVNMINRALGLKVDSVGPIVLGDNVFIGHGAIVLPNVRIGSNVIVAAGAIVAGDIPAGVVVAGVPAKAVRAFDEHVDAVQRRHASYPWRHLVESRDLAFDPSLQPRLLEMRRAHFFGAEPSDEATPAKAQDDADEETESSDLRGQPERVRTVH